MDKVSICWYCEYHKHLITSASPPYLRAAIDKHYLAQHPKEPSPRNPKLQFGYDASGQ